MKNTLLITAAAAALIGSGGIVSAQAPNSAPNAPAASQAAPSGERPAAADHNNANDSRTVPGGMKAGQAEKMPRNGDNAQRAQDNMDKSKDSMKGGQRNAEERKTGTTTGQAGAGAKMTTEQRTSIRTSITKQNIKPTTNINFSVSVGTRVPRTVGFHPLPVEVVTIYPDWRGYEFFLVNDQIVVVNPRTLEIVAVLDA